MKIPSLRDLHTRLVLAIEGVLHNVLNIAAVLTSACRPVLCSCYTHRAPHLAVLNIAVEDEEGVGRGGRAVQRVDGTRGADVSSSSDV